ncbi:MAG: beta-ketoacyl synthase [Tannerella sp.]|nr:beta-ketoacyl synthase [Tannerella sp.]
MTTLIGDNIISALGFSSEENYRNVKAGVCGLKLFSGRYDIPEPFMASEIDNELLEENFKLISSSKNIDINYTKLEKASIVSAALALKNTDIDPSDERVLFVLSTTKGNVFLLDKDENALHYSDSHVYLWRSAELVAGFFGAKNTPLVVSNACISGAAALLAAQRELRSGRYDYAVVIGVDVLSKFIITGFQSFKALSQEVCRPFDANRSGLNIGEAAATIILSEQPDTKGYMSLTSGAIRNDANHISGPSRTGEGSYLALQSALGGIDVSQLAFICAHGTATLYNDEMESIALARMGLLNVPVNSLKGYFGHTLGAAGVLESVISTRALSEGIVLKTYGFETIGVTNPFFVPKEILHTQKKHCVKMLSGFGGCNIALVFSKT